MAQDTDDHHPPFEGPEKLLEIWFAPSASDVPSTGQRSGDRRFGLRAVDRKIWEEMLDIVKCQVLSVVEGDEMDAYLLSESSFFVAPHRLILKTCGTTLNLLGLPRILEIASMQANLPNVYRCFYSRKSFMFPERQLGPHREWKQEVEYLDGIFTNGAAYTVGKVNGDHWLLYMTNPDEINSENICISPIDQPDDAVENVLPDYTIEILMSNLATAARRPFFSSLSPSDDPHAHAAALSEALGISRIFPPNLTTLDAYSFSPCGYSANALVKWGGTSSDTDLPYLINGTKSDRTSQNLQTREGYYTIHVTPEEGWSYASFECNVPSHASGNTGSIPDLKSLVQRVAAIFKPGRLSLTLFISSLENDDGQGESVEAAQRAFKMALTDPDLSQGDECTGLGNSRRKGTNGVGGQRYRRTEKINYEFGGYDLAFASFELMS